MNKKAVGEKQIIHSKHSEKKNKTKNVEEPECVHNEHSRFFLFTVSFISIKCDPFNVLISIDEEPYLLPSYTTVCKFSTINALGKDSQLQEVVIHGVYEFNNQADFEHFAGYDTKTENKTK